MSSLASDHSLLPIPCGCGGRLCTFRTITPLTLLPVAYVSLELPSPFELTDISLLQVAGVVFYVAKGRFLPRRQPDKMFRWDYDYVEFGDVRSVDSYGPADIDANFHPDSDEWTVGSSSSVSSGSISPVDESQSLWEGETLASHSDTEAHR